MPERPWHVRSVETLHDDSHAVVERHDVETPDGRSFLFPLVRTRGYVKVLPVTTTGEVVFVRQYRHALGRALLELPAGGLEPGETVEQAAVRELAEEALLRPGALQPLGRFLTSPGRMDESGTLFLATDCEHDPAAVPHEPTRPVHVPIAAALDLIGTELDDATSALALLLARDRLRSIPARPDPLR